MAIEIIVGIFLCILGILAKKKHFLIAGYNTMSKSEKARYDINKLAKFIGNSFIILGIIIVVSYYVLSYFNLTVYAKKIPPILIPVTFVFLLISSQKCKYKK